MLSFLSRNPKRNSISMSKLVEAIGQVVIDLSVTCALMAVAGLPVFVAIKFGENVSLAIFTPVFLIILFAGNLRRNSNGRKCGK